MFRVADPKMMSLHERCRLLEPRGQAKARETFIAALDRLGVMQVQILLAKSPQGDKRSQYSVL